MTNLSPTTPFGSSSFERSREAPVENARVTTAFSTTGLDKLDPALEANGYSVITKEPTA
ncbi:hypothetical protein [Sphingomonas sp. Leaf5]|uniref:hypothetical protein n=1 Tax=Sphingomonas sp. Leaf5 TaxID=1735671 RepID=UPI000AD5ACD5|nr:hypothetical protein [Sphingomonas sp. Leaf5]